MRMIVIIILFVLFLSDCSLPTQHPGVVQTAIAQTKIAFVPSATLTSVPTETPTIIPSPTSTQKLNNIYFPAILLALIDTQTPVPAIEVTPTIALPAGVSDCMPTNTERSIGNVTKVVDGDTIDVRIGNQTYRVRYIGIDAPESATTQEQLGRQASNKNKELVQDKIVTLIKDVSETDRYNRLLRYVLVGDTFVNYELVRLGFASAIAYPPDVACESVFLGAQQSAMSALAGLWAPTAAPPISEPPPTSVSSGGGNCDPAYPGVCIPPPPPDLDCKDIPYRRFKVVPPDPHRFDGDHDGIGCES